MCIYSDNVLLLFTQPLNGSCKAEDNLCVSSCTRFLKNFPRRYWVPILLSSSNADKVTDMKIRASISKC